jgi:hypothetical protein
MLRRIAMAAVLAGLLASGAASGAQAQQPTSAGQPASSAPGWTFDLTPYVWFATINSGMNLNLPPALGGTVTTDTSVGFGEILTHLNFAAMVAADARYDRFSILTDFVYMNLGGVGSQFRSVNFPNHPSIPISGTVQNSVSLRLSAPIWTLAGGYTVARGDWGNFDAIAGFRFLGLNARINYNLAVTITGPRGNGATFGGTGSVFGSTDIWNGIAGFRGRILISNTGFFIPYYFDIGAGGSNLTWQIASGVGYQTRYADLSLTYRYLTFQQGNSSVLEHLSVRGPMIAATFRF